MDRETAEEIKNEFRRQLAVLRETVHSGLDRIVEGPESLRRDLSAKIDGLRSDMEREFEETRTMIRLLSEASGGASSTSKLGSESPVRASSASKRS